MTLLVIDLGSSSARTLLFDDDARLIDGSVRSRRHDFATDSAGLAIADSSGLRELVESCIDETLAHPAATSIRAVGMATFAGNWLGLDERGDPCTPLYTYADTRGRIQIPALLEKLSGDAEPYHQATGCMLHPAYLPAQYAVHCASDAAAERRIRRVSDVAGYLYRCWFGRDMPTSLSVASWSGLLDSAGCDWHWDYARLLVGDNLVEKLPALADFADAQVGLAGDYARRWRPLRACPFFLPLGDGAAANIGSGAVDAGRIALTIGTTSALRVVKHIERVPVGLWRYLVDGDMPLVGGATSEGGNVYQWVMEELLHGDETLEARLADCAPDGHGLTVLPLLAGERAPGWRAGASGTIHGIGRHTGRLDILQAHLEAVALRLSLIYDNLKSEGAEVMAGGGALQSSPAWARMMADSFDTPIHLLAEAEITARGVALMMRRSLDGAPLDVVQPEIEKVIYPAPDRVQLLRRARERQLDLYRRLYA
ncbi:MAG: FGGY-family carbohydrate kinase [Chloroflexota bacterium]|nr:FGGY-family carbohydrate kinase [Chloroflexota bacterium]MDE2907643.1 FGGY-family carbohydrate kinase [Chloroflexota bacterium]